MFRPKTPPALRRKHPARRMLNRFPYSRRTSNPAGSLPGFHAGRTLFVCTAAGTLLLCSGITQAVAQDTPAAAAAEKQKPSYPDKESGDRARTAGEYGTAASFYRQYRAKAEQNGDQEARKDAYARELDALILANLADSAKKLLDEYRAAFPQLNANSVSLWQAEICLLQRRADEADKILQRLIPGLEKLDPSYLRALSCAAFVAELKGDHAAAAKCYGEIAGNKTLFGRRASERQVLSLAALGKYEDAYAILKSLPEAENMRDVDALKLLSFYLKLSEKGAEAISDDWSGIKSVSTPRKDNFFFLAACRIGEEFSRRDDYVRAAEAFNLAYSFASVREDAFDAMTRLIGAFQRLKDKKTAADLASRMLTLFKDSKLSPDFKLQIASVLFQAGRPDDALDICLTCIFDTASLDDILAEDPSLRYDYAYECMSEVGLYADLLDAAAVLRKADPEHFDPEAVYLSAVAQDRTGDAAAAAQSYLDYEKAAPKTVETQERRAAALYAAGRLQIRLGEPGKAVESLRRLRQDYSSLPAAEPGRYWLIHAMYSSGDEVGAERESWRFIEDDPESEYAGAALLRLAEHYRGIGSVQHAESTVDQLLNQEKYPKIRARASYEKALIAYQRDDLTSALSALDAIDALSPDAALAGDVHYLRGDIARAFSDFTKARAEYEAAAKAVPGSLLEQAALGSAADCVYALATGSAVATKQKETASTVSQTAAKPAPASQTDTKPSAAVQAAGTPKTADTAKSEDTPKTAAPEVVFPSAEACRLAAGQYQALLKLKNLRPEYEAMAYYKAGQSLWKAGDEKEAFGLFNKTVYLVPAEDAASRPVEAFWIFRAVDALESLAHKDPSVSNVESAVGALRWLEQTGTVDQASVRQRIRALRKKQYQPPVPAVPNTTTSPESTKS